MDHVWLWTQFAIASALIVFAAGRLSRYADILSEKLKLGHVFVGMVFLGWITSLPELVLSLGSTIYVGEPDLAVGNVLGSCLFNLTILVVADIIVVRGLLFTRTHPGSAITGTVSLVMLFLAGFGLMLPSVVSMPSALGIDIFSWLIIVFYVISTGFLYRFDKKSSRGEKKVLPQRAQRTQRNTIKPENFFSANSANSAVKDSVSMMKVTIASLGATVVIVGAGLYMAGLGDEIATKYGIAHSFVGTLFFAIVSSLPELSTTIAAARLGFFDMCLGNIFGSNIFNIMIIGVSDIFYRKGSIIAAPDTDSRSYFFWVTVFTFAATLIVIIGIRRKSSRLFWRISWISLTVAACYIIGLFVIRLL
jgi:cation:H+ antiporter